MTQRFDEVRNTMKSSHAKFALLASLPVALGGCQGVVWGNMAVLGITVCLFFGTLSLGRRPPAAPSATRTHDSRPRMR